MRKDPQTNARQLYEIAVGQGGYPGDGDCLGPLACSICMPGKRAPGRRRPGQHATVWHGSLTLARIPAILASGLLGSVWCKAAGPPAAQVFGHTRSR